MLELFNSKRFSSFLIGIVLLIIVNLLFAEKPDTVETLQYFIAGLCGLHITTQGVSDAMGKGKVVEQRKLVEAEVVLKKLNGGSPTGVSIPGTFVAPFPLPHEKAPNTGKAPWVS